MNRAYNKIIGKRFCSRRFGQMPAFATTLLTLLVVCSANTLAGPGVLSTSPAQNQLNVSASADIQVTFDSDINASTITGQSFIVNGRENRHTGTISYDAGTRTATMSLSNGFAPGEVVTVTLTRDIQSTGFQPLDSSYGWSFTSEVTAGAGTFIEANEYGAGSQTLSVVACVLKGTTIPDLAATASAPTQNLRTFHSQGDGSFYQATTLNCGDSVRAVVAADFNGDSWMDLATANWGSANVSVIMNEGAGIFPQTEEYDAGTNPRSLCAADFDADGYPDLATANYSSGTISVLINNGEGVLAAPESYSAGANPFYIIAADFNGDGLTDLANTNSHANSVSVFRGNGDGTFAAAVYYAVGDRPRGIEAADVDGDGDVDIVTANGNAATVSVLINQNNAGFATHQEYSSGVDPFEVHAGDLNADGILDLATANGGMAGFSALIGDGSGAFTLDSVYSNPDQPYSLALSDIDGDADLDIITANYAGGNITIYKNTNTGPTWHVSTSGSDVVGGGSASRPFETIRFAEQSASSGDTIVIHDGQYSEHITFLHDTLTLRSLNGMGTVLIQSDTSRVLTIDSSTMTIKGLDLTGIAADSGGAVYARQSNVSLRECGIRDSEASFAGGGIYATQCTLTVIGCEISNNVAEMTVPTVSYGGGICIDGTLTVDSSTIEDNQAHSLYANDMINISAYGGGVYCRGDSMIIRNSSILRNACSGRPYGAGGGIYVMGDYFVLDNLVVEGNQGPPGWVRLSGSASGGGIWASGNGGSVIGCLIKDNECICSSAQSLSVVGGGIYMFGWDNLFMNNHVRGNTAAAVGGVFLYETGNPSARGGGAFINWGIVQNNIFDHNFAWASIKNSHEPRVANALSAGGGCYLVTPDTVRGNTFAFNRDSSHVSNTTEEGDFTVESRGAGCYLNEVDKFTDNVIAFNRVVSTEDNTGDLATVTHIREGVEVYNNGSTSSSNVYYSLEDDTWWSGTMDATDNAANPRFCGAVSGDYYVASNSPCASYNSPSGNQIGAFGVNCIAITTIYVDGAVSVDSGDGTLLSPYGSIQTAVDAAMPGDMVEVFPGSYSESITIDKSITLRGSSPTDTTYLRAPTGSRVITIENSPDTVYIRNLDISMGHPAAESYNGRGGGILVYNSPAVISDCNIHDNISDAVPDYCGGGGVCFYDGSYVELRDNIIHHNEADDGGGIIASYGNLGGKLIGNTIYRNTSYDAGGGVFLFRDVEAGIHFDVSNNTIVLNSSKRGGFGLQTYKVDLDILDCIIAYNRANPGESCVGSAGLLMSYTDGMSSSVDCTDLYGNCDGYDFSLPGELSLGPDCFSEPPLFCDTATDNFSLYSNSPCAFANSPCSRRIGALDTACTALTELRGNPTSLLFSGIACGANPEEQSISITAADGSAVGISATENAGWLSISPESDSTPATVTVSIDLTGLTDGNYNTQISVTSPGADSSLSIPVTLTLAANPPQLDVSPTSVSLAAQAGSADPVCREVVIINTGCGSLNWAASGVGGWMQASPSSGGAPDTITICGDAASLSEGLYTDTITIDATTAGFQEIEVNLLVTAAGLDSVVVRPRDTSLYAGLGAPYTATGYYSDNSEGDLTNEALWQTSDENVAVVDQSGLVSSIAQGSTWVIATLADKADTVTLTVDTAAVVALLLSPEADTIAQGEVTRLQAVVWYTDASEKDVSADVTWTSLDEDVVTVDDTGLVTSVGSGQAGIVAEYTGALAGDVADTATVLVMAPQLVEISLQPATFQIFETHDTLLTATGIYSDGSSANLPRTSLTWGSDKPDAVSVDTGLVSGTAPTGAVLISAFLDNVTGYASGRVDPLELTSIYVTPDSIDVLDEDQFQLQAYGIFSDGSEHEVTDSVTWTPLDNGIASLSSPGLLMAVSPGVSRVEAKGDYAATAVVVVHCNPTPIPPDPPLPGEDFVIEIDFSEPPDTAWLHYRAGGSQTFASTEMSPNGNRYQAIIANQATGLRSLEYYFEAYDNQIYDTLPNPPTNYGCFKLQKRLSTSATAISTLGRTHHMIGFPFDPDPSDAATVLTGALGSYDPARWKFGTWVSLGLDNGFYLRYPDLESIERERGFWIITEGSSSLGAAGYTALADEYVRDTGWARISLAPGWNQISNPFAFSISWDDRVVLSNDADSVENMLHHYDGGFDVTSSMLPFVGYFARNNHATDTIDVLLPYIEHPVATAPFVDKFTGSSDCWAAGISLGDDKPADCWIGVHPEASAMWDKLDLSRPPAVNAAQVNLGLSNIEGHLGEVAGDFHCPTDTTSTWILNLLDKSNSGLTLYISDASIIPQELQFIVSDIEGSNRGALTANRPLALPPLGAMSQLVVTTQLSGDGDADEARPADLPRDFALYQNRPNPFNPTTQIEFWLPQSTRAVLEIFNIAGQKVRTLVNENLSAGSHAYAWDGSDAEGRDVASGIYLYRLSAGEFSVTKKMVLLK